MAIRHHHIFPEFFNGPLDFGIVAARALRN